MKRTVPLFLVLACTVAVGAFLLLPSPADASCYGWCQRVNGCKTCITASEPTGILCDQSGPCGCYFIPCPYALQSSVDAFTSPDDVPDFLQEDLANAERSTLPEDGCTLTAQIFGEGVEQATD